MVRSTDTKNFDSNNVLACPNFLFPLTGRSCSACSQLNRQLSFQVKAMILTWRYNGVFQRRFFNLVNIRLLYNDRIVKKYRIFNIMGLKKRSIHAFTMSFFSIITGEVGSNSKEDESTESQQWTCEQ